ncbi:GntR family transcriptional regulator [Bacillus canaveralius]|uniref:GntR family transcriptional regulator n=1 Tax=Bacillus canaveralius TaxID=1403243 RepID=UPI001639FDFB|nr:GntR family transcriptional regulator [Bacillus canaveralius]
MEIEKIEVSTINKEVYDRLKNRLRKGEFKPGEKISIRQIAEIFGVSTMPVREALRVLQAEGFVKFDRRSIVVRQLSLREVKEIFAIRQRLETLATEWALPNLTLQDLNELKDIVKQMDDPDISHADWERLNQEFHLHFYELSESGPLVSLIRNVWDSITPYMYIYISSVDSFNQAQAEHHSIIQLIKDNNLQGLLTLTVNHLQYTCNIISEALEKDGQC